VHACAVVCAIFWAEIFYVYGGISDDGERDDLWGRGVRKFVLTCWADGASACVQANADTRGRDH
jgi:hypothetical protein